MTGRATISFTAPIERSTNRLWGAHVRVPAAAVAAMNAGTSRRIRCSVEGLPERQCALLPIGKGTMVIAINATLRAKLGCQFGDRIRLTIRRDASNYGLPMPEELEELLRQDKRANALFHSLTPGRRRTLLHIVGSVRRPDLRLLRANAVVRHLHAHDGQIHYRELYASLK